MKILLDTHVFLWAILEPNRLTASMKRDLVDPTNELLFSSASIWEIGIKYALGKLPLKIPPDILLSQQMQLQGVECLALNAEHAHQGYKLPLHHKDPFDRMLVAQAKVEKLPVMTSDPLLAPYGIKILR